jgi:phage gpG-like protein
MKIEYSTNADDVMKRLAEDLGNYKKNLKLQVFSALSLLEAEMLQNIRTKSGLKVRSGALLNSIGASKKVTENSDGTISGEIGPQGIPYAAIHEFGGQTKPHQIKPRNAAALRFMGNAGPQFAKFVNHPGSKIPARPYMRPALAAQQENIAKNFGLFIQANFSRE